MSPLRCLILTAMLLAASVRPAVAEWRVERVLPVTNYTQGAAWVPLQRGMVVPDQAWIHTGVRGRVLLRNGGSVIEIKPNTVAMLAFRPSRRVKDTSVFVKIGRVFLDIEGQTAGEVSVASPFLAATIKGTRFDLTVGVDRADAHVRRGVVAVTDLARGLQVDLRQSQRASVTGRALVLGGRGPFGPIVEKCPRAPQIDPARRQIESERTGAAPVLEH